MNVEEAKGQSWIEITEEKVLFKKEQNAEGLF